MVAWPLFSLSSNRWVHPFFFYLLLLLTKQTPVECTSHDHLSLMCTLESTAVRITSPARRMIHCRLSHKLGMRACTRLAIELPARSLDIFEPRNELWTSFISSSCLTRWCEPREAQTDHLPVPGTNSFSLYEVYVCSMCVRWKDIPAFLDLLLHLLHPSCRLSLWTKQIKLKLFLHLSCFVHETEFLSIVSSHYLIYIPQIPSFTASLRQQLIMCPRW